MTHRNRTARRLLVALGLGGLVALSAVSSCKKNNAQNGPNCAGTGQTCTVGDECCTGYCDETFNTCAREPGSCLAADSECAIGTECCSYSCVDNRCSSQQCTSDNESCSSDGQCCSGSCTGGSCTPLNPTCRTSGNSCTTGPECCSQYCVDNLCSGSPSYCTQVGDTCTADFECCGGLCFFEGGASLGTCSLVPATGAGGCLSAGEVCGGTWDGSPLPLCGSECCSRACRPYGPTNMLICQPPSGCRPTGEVCREDIDCCGALGNPDGETAHITCSKVGDNPLGRCDAGNSCTPAGGICRLSNTSCRENPNCCSGNSVGSNTCQLDTLGIPRCLAVGMDCSTVDASTLIGEPCATAADCCGLPCTPEGSGEFPMLVCGGETCVGSGGACTTTSDCCAGLPCSFPPGSTQGTCGEDTGACAEYGQGCTVAADCCNNLDCIDNACAVIVN